MTIKVGGYVVKKGQPKAAFVKEGGVVTHINNVAAVVTDGLEHKSYLLSDLRTLNRDDTTLLGVHLLVNPKEKKPMSTSDPNAPQREMTLREQLEDHIIKTDSQIKYLEVTEKKAAPPAVQEIVLARRHLEDAANRLKRAMVLAPSSELDR